MAQHEMTIKIDADDAVRIIGKCLEPGSVLLSADAVHRLWNEHGVRMADLLAAGGIAAPQVATDHGEILADIYTKTVPV